MTRLDGTRHPDPTGAAIDFLAAPGRAERVLATHHDRGDGRCAGCFVHQAWWPCSVARLAQVAVVQRATPPRTPTTPSASQAAGMFADPPATAARPYVDSAQTRKATA
jgi:hypothetical protein